MKNKKQVLSAIFCLLFSQQYTLGSTKKIIVLTIPKSGTHLLAKCVQLITGKKPSYNFNATNWNEQIYLTHAIKFASLKPDTTIVTILRDPRDRIISHLNALDWRGFRINKNTPQQEVLKDILRNPANGFRAHYRDGNIYNNVKTLSEHYDSVMPYIKKHFTTYFERLVGPRGGGNTEDQYNEIDRIARHLGYSLNHDQIVSIAENLFGGSHSFKKGTIGAWKEFAHDQEIKDLFKKSLGKALIDIGYELDNNW